MDRSEPETSPPGGGRRLLLVDAGACSGCGLCVVACKDEHVGQAQKPWAAAQPDTGQFWVRIESVERGRAPRTRVTHLPVACQHCDDAPCITACPDGAIKRRADGLVWIDPDACTGCGKCVPACPFDAIAVDADRGVAQKCTGCAHRVDEGLQPRCVEICPHDVFTLADEASLAAPNDGEHVQLLPEADLSPRVLWRGLPQPYISGCLVDRQTDDVVVGARVVATDVIDGQVSEDESNAFGEFRLDGLKDGRVYELRALRSERESALGTVTLQGFHDLGDVTV